MRKNIAVILSYFTTWDPGIRRFWVIPRPQHWFEPVFLNWESDRNSLQFATAKLMREDWRLIIQAVTKGASWRGAFHTFQVATYQLETLWINLRMFFCFETSCWKPWNYSTSAFSLESYSFYSYRESFPLNKMEKLVGAFDLNFILSSGKTLIIVKRKVVVKIWLKSVIHAIWRPSI